MVIFGRQILAAFGVPIPATSFGGDRFSKAPQSFKNLLNLEIQTDALAHPECFRLAWARRCCDGKRRCLQAHASKNEKRNRFAENGPPPASPLLELAIAGKIVESVNTFAVGDRGLRVDEWWRLHRIFCGSGRAVITDAFRVSSLGTANISRVSNRDRPSTSSPRPCFDDGQRIGKRRPSITERGSWGQSSPGSGPRQRQPDTDVPRLTAR